MYLLGRIGYFVKDYPRVVQFVLNGSIGCCPLCSPFGRAEVNVSIYLLLLNVRDKSEDIAVTLGVCRIDISYPLINVV